jgi:hypothetical protein
MPDPVLTWTIVGLVWGVGLFREAYKAGCKAGNRAVRPHEPSRPSATAVPAPTAAGRSVDLAGRSTPDKAYVTIGGRTIEVDATSIIER